MAVEKYTQEERVFAQKAISGGFSQKEIEQSINRRRAKSSFYGKVAESKILPAIPAVIGALIGLAGAGPAGMAYGAAGGWGLGEMLKSEAAQARGIKYGEEPLTKEAATKQLGGQVTRTATAGAAGYGAGQTLNFLNNLRHPLQWTGQNLEKQRTKTTYNPSETEKNIYKSLQENKSYITGDEAYKSKLIEPITRLTSQKPDENLNTIYKNWMSMRENTDPDIYRLLNKQVVRPVINPLQNKSAQNLSSIYELLKNLEPYKGRIAGGTAAASGGYLLWRKLVPLLEGLSEGGD